MAAIAALRDDPRALAPEGVLNLGQLLGALSHALDMTEGQPPGHCIRSCWIGMQIGRELGLGDAQLADLYYTILLKDLGCSSNAARICQLYLSDDLAFKGAFKSVDGSMRQALAFVIRHTGPDLDLVTRLRTVTSVLRNADAIAQDLIETRCHQGADIAQDMGFSPAVCDGIQHLDEHWDGGGRAAGLKGDRIPLLSRIALAAQVIDVFHRQSGPDAALHEIASRGGTWFDPEIARVVAAGGTGWPVWAQLADPGIEERVFDAEPARAGWRLDDGRIDDIVQGFARVIDAKSPYTHGHSSRVSRYADLACRQMGFDRNTRRWMRRAALLHDIGKLAVSSQILDKPDRLTEEEFAVMKTHPIMGRRVLERIDLFRPLARLAATHHERLDGKGYPHGIAADGLTTQMRLLTVADIFDALTADRPYRKAMPLEQAWAIMDDMRGSAIDAACLDALRAGVAVLDPIDLA